MKLHATAPWGRTTRISVVVGLVSFTLVCLLLAGGFFGTLATEVCPRLRSVRSADFTLIVQIAALTGPFAVLYLGMAILNGAGASLLLRNRRLGTRTAVAALILDTIVFVLPSWGWILVGISGEKPYRTDAIIAAILLSLAAVPLALIVLHALRARRFQGTQGDG